MQLKWLKPRHRSVRDGHALCGKWHDPQRLLHYTPQRPDRTQDAIRYIVIFQRTVHPCVENVEEEKETAVVEGDEKVIEWLFDSDRGDNKSPCWTSAHVYMVELLVEENRIDKLIWSYDHLRAGS